VSLSPRLADAIRAHARASSRNTSHCIERAWMVARVRFATLPSPAPLAQDFEILPIVPDVEYTDVRAEQLYAERFASDQVVALSVTLASDILEDMVDESFRLARSLGWLVERAWCLALESEPMRATWFANELTAGDTMPMPRFD
jgi:hypothetical protein